MTKKNTTSDEEEETEEDEQPVISNRRVVPFAEQFRPRNWKEAEAGHHIKEIKGFSHKKFPPPRTDKIFVARWREFIVDVARRENFKQGHLAQLRVLCDMYVEYDYLERFLQKKGYSYETISPHGGRQFKARPEAAQLNKIRSEIRCYSKALGLVLVKDKTHDNTPPGEESDWE